MCSFGIKPRIKKRQSSIVFLLAENSQTQMVTTSDAALMNGGLMVQAGAMGPTTVMGQIMGALNTGLAEDLNIEALEHGFDCNVDEVRNNINFIVIGIAKISVFTTDEAKIISTMSVK